MTQAEYQRFLAFRAAALRQIEANIQSQPGPILGSTFNYRKFSKPDEYSNVDLRRIVMAIAENGYIRRVK